MRYDGESVLHGQSTWPYSKLLGDGDTRVRVNILPRVGSQ